MADSGAGRVIKFDPAAKKQDVVAVITGYSLDVYGKGPMYNIGPLGLAFLDKNTLVVGDGGLKDGDELVRVYDLSSGKALKADDMKYKLGPITAGEESEKGEGNFYGVAASKTAIYVTCNGDDTKGWLARSEIEGGKPGELKPFIATKKVLEEAGEPTDAPVGITLNQKRSDRRRPDGRDQQAQGQPVHRLRSGIGRVDGQGGDGLVRHCRRGLQPQDRKVVRGRFRLDGAQRRGTVPAGRG